jgi:hypothetical protein
MIIEQQVEPSYEGYKIRLGADGNFHGRPNYLYAQAIRGRNDTLKDGMQRWWKERERMSLKQIQSEAIRWTIQKETDIGFPKTGDREMYLDPLVEKLAELAER